MTHPWLGLSPGWRLVRIVAAAIAILALALPAASVAGSWARSNDLARKFPDFKKQKKQLTTIAVVVDVAEFEVDDGQATWVYLDDCRGLAQKLEDAFVVALGAKGYPVKSQPVLSVGHGADTTKTCRVFSSWEKRDLRPKDLAPARPPFYSDSTLNATPDLLSAWRSVVQGTSHLKGPKRGAPALVPGAAMVRGVLGADYALVAVGLGTKNILYHPAPTYHRVGTGQTFAEASVPDDSPYPGSRVRVALIDCRNGHVLWADDTSDIRAFKEARMDDIADDIVAQMP